MSFASRLYLGSVMHRRLRPRRHRLKHRMFWLLLDLDELPRLDRALRLFGHNRAAPISFHDRDHGDGQGPLRAYVERQLAGAGIDIGDGAIRFIAMPRIFGFAFNPLAIYLCHRPDGALAAVLYEVNNTFGERHSYLVPVEGTETGTLRQTAGKEFYVSPFMDMDMTYEFRIAGPAEKLSVGIVGSDRDGPMIAAAFAGDERPLDDRNLLRTLLTFPLLGFKVLAAIHVHAALLALKGLRLRRRPPVPAEPVSLVRSGTHLS